MTTIKTPKKLIEVALPLDDINAAAAREKSIRHGHPSTLHLWWARRPLAAARAVLFAQLVNDPGYQREIGFGVNKKEAEIKREALFQIIRDLVKWENTNNEEVLNRARAVIWESWRETCHLNRNHPQARELFNLEKLPAFHDPFAGGGSIPLEAQRLGLEAYASDLNPVAVMINKAMIEIPPRFAGCKPVGPLSQGENSGNLMEDWTGAMGLAEDVRRYGHWMREQAFKRIGHLYPKVKITAEMVEGISRSAGIPPAEAGRQDAGAPGDASREYLRPYMGQELTVIAWLWARTVKSPNPAFSHVDVPLVSSFVLSSKKGKEAYVQPVVEGDRYHFEVKLGVPPIVAKDGTKASDRGANFNCLVSGSLIGSKYIKTEGQAGLMGQRLMAVVAEGNKGRVYLTPIDEIENISKQAEPNWRPSGDVPARLTGGTCVPYGLKEWNDLFTPRQLVALTTFSDLVQEAREKVIADAKAAGMADDGKGLDAGCIGASSYGDAVAVYLGFVSDKVSDYWSSICSWHSSGEKMRNTFGRQAIPMVWDYAEANPFCSSSGNWIAMVDWTWKALARVSGSRNGVAIQQNAAIQTTSQNKIISTDPPYYDNIGYADLSDFFYVWMRRSLRGIYPNLFATLAVPKAEELVATPYRHGSKKKAEAFFMDGRHALSGICLGRRIRRFRSPFITLSSRRKPGKAAPPVPAGKPFWRQ